ncbi:hypothetical protein [Chryseobacterium sp.]|uniref:hypothetical protein n=1 Tax=Chryseobacterium sp. TaxID=1871047 RepID=UPI0028A22D09|nr:hypothetical protein [Chryseobacterium sp.]
MSQLFYGSINYDALLNAIKTGKVKTFKSTSGVRLVNINVWVNDQPDKFDNDASIQVQLKDEFRTEKGDYIGNLRKHIKNEPQAVDAEIVKDPFTGEDDDLPF